MSEETTNDNQTEPTPRPAPTRQADMNPDALMNDFQGKPIVKIVVFTLIIHAIFIGIFSTGYLKSQVMGEDSGGLEDKERMDIALREGTAALLKIAEEHRVDIKDLTKNLAEGKAPEEKKAPTNGSAKQPASGGSDESAADEAYRKQQEDAGPAPLDPDITGGLDEDPADEDIAFPAE